MEKTQTYRFIDSLTPPWTKAEFNNLTDVYPTLDAALSDRKANVYHLCWVDKSLRKRAKDRDVFIKNYFAIDIDLFNNFRDSEDFKWIEITKEELLLDAKIIMNELNLHQWFKDWRYIVFSGRWIHIYYTGKPKAFDIREYWLWVGAIFKVINELLDNYEPYKTDDACKNLWRIMRLPWSINQKNGELVEIIYQQDTDSEIFDQIPLFAEKALSDIKWEHEKEQAERARKYEENRKLDALISKKSYVDNTDRIEAYMKEIDAVPAYLISEKLLPQFKFDDRSRKNFHSDNPANRWTAFYYCEDINAICNGWSHHYSWGTSTSCYSSSNLVKNHLQLSWKETYEWFESNFGIRFNH